MIQTIRNNKFSFGTQALTYLVLWAPISLFIIVSSLPVLLIGYLVGCLVLIAWLHYINPPRRRSTSRPIEAAPERTDKVYLEAMEDLNKLDDECGITDEIFYAHLRLRDNCKCEHCTRAAAVILTAINKRQQEIDDLNTEFMDTAALSVWRRWTSRTYGRTYSSSSGTGSLFIYTSMALNQQPLVNRELLPKLDELTIGIIEATAARNKRRQHWIDSVHANPSTASWAIESMYSLYCDAGLEPQGEECRRFTYEQLDLAEQAVKL